MPRSPQAGQTALHSEEQQEILPPNIVEVKDCGPRLGFSLLCNINVLGLTQRYTPSHKHPTFTYNKCCFHQY